MEAEGPKMPGGLGGLLCIEAEVSLEPVPAWNIILGPGKFSSHLYLRLLEVLKTNENKTILSILSGS